MGELTQDTVETLTQLVLAGSEYDDSSSDSDSAIECLAELDYDEARALFKALVEVATMHHLFWSTDTQDLVDALREAVRKDTPCS